MGHCVEFLKEMRATQDKVLGQGCLKSLSARHFFWASQIHGWDTDFS